MGCLACGRYFHSECENGGCDSCHGDIEKAVRSFKSSTHNIGAPTKDPDKITDPYSTGRKRAAIQYPLFKTNPCEWRGKKNCGGGKSPIVGCITGTQQARHHGPVKNPLRNEPGNVHRICTKCHNRWHELNDSVYIEEEYNNLPHNPELATELELWENDAKWKLGQMKPNGN